jgi:hypothetical protein
MRRKIISLGETKKESNFILDVKFQIPNLIIGFHFFHSNCHNFIHEASEASNKRTENEEIHQKLLSLISKGT